MRCFWIRVPFDFGQQKTGLKTLLYIGNMLVPQGATISVMEEHGKMLEPHFKVYYASCKKNKILRLLDMIESLLQRRREADFIIISVYSTLNFYYAWSIALLCRVFRKPYICYLHGGNLPARMSRSPLMSSAIFAFALANVAPSAYLKNAFQQAGYKTILIPNFIQLAQYAFLQRRMLRPRFLWVRSFEKTYHPEMAMQVFAAIQREYPEAQLCMVGTDKDGSMERCKKLAAELKIAGQVKFMGGLPKSEWIALAKDYDIFISTTHVDNTPVSVMEAMALGLPIVSTNVGGVPFLLTHHETGLLSPDNEIPAMVQNIQSLLNSPVLAEGLSKNARQKAESFDWTAIEKQWLDLLQ